MKKQGKNGFSTELSIQQYFFVLSLFSALCRMAVLHHTPAELRENRREGAALTPLSSLLGERCFACETERGIVTPASDVLQQTRLTHTHTYTQTHMKVNFFSVDVSTNLLFSNGTEKTATGMQARPAIEARKEENRAFKCLGHGMRKMEHLNCRKAQQPRDTRGEETQVHELCCVAHFCTI